MIAMGILVFWRQRLLRAELSQLIERSRDSFDGLKNLQEKLIQSEKLASLGQLVGGAAHEINNPLTAMLGYSELLSASNLPPEENLQAAQVAAQVRRTTTLVASLLTFARQAPAQLAAVDINSVLQTAGRLLAPQLDAEASSIHFELTPSLPSVLVDSNQILHVCMHLAGQVGAHRNSETSASLFISTQRQGNFVVVDFASHDAASAPLFFLSQLGSEGANKPATLSLGACCRIVEEHGGRLLQASTPGNPAFRMELRLAANEVSRSSLAANKRAAARSGS
jgi:two-component system NtrC family sensor kinase